MNYSNLGVALLMASAVWGQAVAPATRTKLSQIQPPSVTAPRLIVVVPVPTPGGVVVPMWVQVALGSGLVLDTTGAVPTISVATVAGGGGSLRMESATFDTALNDGTFNFGGGGTVVFVVRNGATLRKGVDYDVTATSIKLTSLQGWSADDVVLVAAQ